MKMKIKINIIHGCIQDVWIEDGPQAGTPIHVHPSLYPFIRYYHNAWEYGRKPLMIRWIRMSQGENNNGNKGE
jgi:hypothetical protein